ncbi:MAG: hypothetical protein ACK4P5_09375, partial [Fimbriimonadales bacterium]
SASRLPYAGGLGRQSRRRRSRSVQRGRRCLLQNLTTTRGLQHLFSVWLWITPTTASPRR